MVRAANAVGICWINLSIKTVLSSLSDRSALVSGTLQAVLSDFWWTARPCHPDGGLVPEGVNDELDRLRTLARMRKGPLLYKRNMLSVDVPTSRSSTTMFWAILLR